MGGFKRLVRLQSCQKVMGSCPAQCKMLLFRTNTVVGESAKFELARLKKEEEEKTTWILVRQEVHTLGIGTGNTHASRTGPGPNIP